MVEILTVRSTPALRKAYQRVLDHDWTKKSLDEVLSLIWNEIAKGETLADSAYCNVLDPSRTAMTTGEPDQGILQRLRDFRSHFGKSPAPPIPKTIAAMKRSPKAETVWTYLILQSLLDIKGDTGLLLDTQSLLFLLALEFFCRS